MTTLDGNINLYYLSRIIRQADQDTLIHKKYDGYNFLVSFDYQFKPVISGDERSYNYKKDIPNTIEYDHVRFLYESINYCITKLQEYGLDREDKLEVVVNKHWYYSSESSIIITSRTNRYGRTISPLPEFEHSWLSNTIIHDLDNELKIHSYNIGEYRTIVSERPKKLRNTGWIYWSKVFAELAKPVRPYNMSLLQMYAINIASKSPVGTNTNDWSGLRTAIREYREMYPLNCLFHEIFRSMDLFLGGICIGAHIGCRKEIFVPSKTHIAEKEELNAILKKIHCLYFDCCTNIANAIVVFKENNPNKVNNNKYLQLHASLGKVASASIDIIKEEALNYYVDSDPMDDINYRAIMLSYYEQVGRIEDTLNIANGLYSISQLNQFLKGLIRESVRHNRRKYTIGIETGLDRW